jgi:multiple sugar transport system ATP-binding protein
VVNDVPPKERDIAMVFQNYALYPHMTVHENMAFALKLRKFPAREIDARVREAAGILGIEAILDRKPRQLSGGQRQRVAVGRAIVRHPQVFLFDEPLSNLDAKLRVQTRKEISKLHQQLGATMIYVTHDQVEAMTMGDRIVVLNAGRVMQVDTPLNLYDHPANRFVAGFIGSPAMNFIAGTVARDDGALHFHAAGDELALPIPAAHRERLGRYEGKALTLGVRPEDISVARAAGDGGNGGAGAHATLRLDVVEPMGNEIFLYARGDAYELTSRIPPQPLPPPGQPIPLAFDLDKLHFFDPDTEASVAG